MVMNIIIMVATVRPGIHNYLSTHNYATKLYEDDTTRRLTDKQNCVLSML